MLLYVALLNNYKPVGEEFFFSENLFARNPSADTFTLLTQTANACLLFMLLLAGATALLWVRVSNGMTGAAWRPWQRC